MSTRSNRKAQTTTNVPVKLARRCGLDGFSTTAGGGLFSLDLGRLLDSAAGLLGSVELECLWLTGGSGLGCAEPEWLAHHYPTIDFTEVPQ